MMTTLKRQSMLATDLIKQLKVHSNAVAVIFLGFTLSLMAAWSYEHYNEVKIKLNFEINVSERFLAVQKSLEETNNSLHSLAQFFSGSQFVDRDEFRNFTSDIISHNSGIRAFEWVPLVTHNQRKNFVTRNRKDFANFRITQKNRNGKIVAATLRDHYFPVEYMEPFLGNEVAMGYDLGSEPLRLKALQKWGNDSYCPSESCPKPH
jgi:CHASE1-domain containing sensor protein